MGSLNDFIPQLGCQDTKKKLQLGAEVSGYLGNAANSVECDDVGVFVDGLVAWLPSSNYKVALYGLEILHILAQRIKEDFRPYLSSVLPAVIDRLGDNKDQVRDTAQSLIQCLMSKVSTPQVIFDRLMPAFSHKNGRVREGIMACLQDTMKKYGAQSLSLSKVVPLLVKLLGDPTAQVRETAVDTIVDVYRYVGERVRLDLTKKFNIPPAKLQVILAKCDEIRDTDQMSPTASLPSCETVSKGSEDESDKGSVSGKGSSSAASKRASSAPPVRRIVPVPKGPPVVATATVKRKRSIRVVGAATAYAAQAGAIDEDFFLRSFEDVPRIQIYSGKEVDDYLSKCREVLNDPNNDWEKRVDSMRRIRSLMLAGAACHEEFFQNLRPLVPPFQISVKDLRSSVVREACITIAYLSQQLGQRVDHFCENLFQNLINLIPNSAKVMSTAGIVAVRFIIQYTHSSKLIPLVATSMSSKSKDIRRACCEFLDQVLHTWPTHILERHIALLQNLIKQGMSDADPEARASARKAYWGFHEHFRDQAEALLASLDSSKQRTLHGDLPMSHSSSSNSLNQGTSGRSEKPRFQYKASSTTGSTENISRLPGYGLRRMNGGPASLGSKTPEINGVSPYPPSPLRSNSAIDMNAVQRARARQLCMSTARKVGATTSLPRPVRKLDQVSSTVSSTLTSPERTRQSRSRAGVSQSQPSSRSGSPSSRSSYATYNMRATPDRIDGVRDPSSVRVRRAISIRSNGTSREASPSRGERVFPSYATERRPSYRRPSLTNSDRSSPCTNGTGLGKSPALMAHQILTQSREAEVAMADALRVSPRRIAAFGNESDDSETSSVCSERSFGSLGRNSFNDVAEVLMKLSSINWADRKDGLQGLQYLLRSGRFLTNAETRKVTDIFTKMFLDPHMKVFSIFLDTLIELIISHHHDLYDWLYVLITRLLNKLGTELLGSVQSKVQSTLETVRESFPVDLQFNALMRFVMDQTQTPNLKVKLELLRYLQCLRTRMMHSHFRASTDVQTACIKILSWTSDPKSSELRKQAQVTLVEFLNLNIPEFNKILSSVPPSQQENKQRLLIFLARRSSRDGSPMKSPPSPKTGPRSLHSPTSLTQSWYSSHLMDYGDHDLVSHEDIQNSLGETCAQIQNFNYESSVLDTGFMQEGALNNGRERVYSDMERDTTSQDSGISQMSAGPVEVGPDGRLMDPLEEKFESSPDSELGIGSPVKRRDYGGALYHEPGPRNNYQKHLLSEAVFDADSELTEGMSNLQLDSVEDVFTQIKDSSRQRVSERVQVLVALSKIIRREVHIAWDVHFRYTLHFLLQSLDDSDVSVQCAGLQALCELLKKQGQDFENFTELTILKVLDCHKDAKKDVVRSAEMCAATAASVLPPDQCVHVLNAIVSTGDYPVNMAAIKMLTKVVDNMSPEKVARILPKVMPSLIKAYDNTESSVRKASVFCMVSIHLSVGADSLKPYLNELNMSKLKLLNVYVKRAQQEQQLLPASSTVSSSQASSGPGSPKVNGPISFTQHR